uniref:Synaptobrevin, longin-like domain protein n=1 Tax=Tanacetum cinerariifolium TaxID=118510 RepID=A0A699GYL3_TANCI|nr:hypothetical protein [Tanacetum cinerariifolium]
MVVYLNKSDASEGFNQVIDFLNGSYIKYALTVNPNIYVSCIKQLWNIVAIKQDNDITRLQALVDKKKVVVTETAIREVLRLDDAEGVDCLSNEEIFAKLVRTGYEKPSTKLTFYKAFFSSQWKFLIHTILQSMSAKRTSWNEFSSAMASAVICLSTGGKFNFSKYIFDSLVRNVDSTSKFYMYPRFIQLLIKKLVEEHVQDVTDGDAAQGDDTTAQGDDAQEPCIPSPTPLTPPPQPPQDLPSTSQVQHTPPQSPQRVGTSQRVDTSKDTMMDDASNQERIIDELDKDDVVALMDKKEEEAKVVKDDQLQGRQVESQAKIYKFDMDHALKVLSMPEDKPAQVHEIVDVATTAKLITETKEQMEEEESRALQTINETPVQKAAKRRKLNKEVEDLKRHLEIVPDEDDDVYTEATPLARKVPVVDYEIIHLNNKPYYKIIRADGTQQLFISFLTLLKNFDREDLEALCNLVKERFSTSKPKNFFVDFLLTTLGAMFEIPNKQAQV